MPTDNNTEATTERREIDPVFKEVVVYDFGQLSLPVQTEVEVSRLPRTMDVLVVLSNAAEIEVVRMKTAFSYARFHNQIELKGESDPLTLWGYRLVLGRANLYLGDNKISAKGNDNYHCLCPQTCPGVGALPQRCPMGRG